ncbi:hypothetical protein K7432_004782 [Basidiobolus ranarum]|uniref:Obg-like ATPase 1 n=1 Tax=Basidiobolus ranarum TaxID=34480 RepID=A0ABR2WXN6_9FUNG
MQVALLGIRWSVKPAVRHFVNIQQCAAFSTTRIIWAKKVSGKNKGVVEEKLLLGRPSNNLKIGVVGLPNVGKSTFFNAITNSTVAAENYPFCTIDPEESRVAVPDSRFDWLCEHYKPASKVPAYLTVIDIAGLVKGAASGEGLGNAFLSHVKSVDAILHVVRAYENQDIIHVEGDINPVRDMEIIHEELRLKDMEFLSKYYDTISKQVTRVGANSSPADKAKKEEADTVKKVMDWVLNENKDVRSGEWSNPEIEVINKLYLLTAKPVIYLANLSEAEYVGKNNKWVPKIKEWVDQEHPGDLVIPFSGEFEEKISGLSEQDRGATLQELNTVSALPEIIVAGYKALQLIYYFTAGTDEVRAWTVRKNTKAPQAAGVIHSDFEHGFIKAEVIKFEDLKTLKTDAAVKANGKCLQKGKDYAVEDGDIVFFKFNKTQSKK